MRRIYNELGWNSRLTTSTRGFAAKAPAKVLETVQTLGNDFHAVIEEEQMVSIVGGSGAV